jgi:hypothetical protein
MEELVLRDGTRIELREDALGLGVGDSPGFPNRDWASAHGANNTTADATIIAIPEEIILLLMLSSFLAALLGCRSNRRRPGTVYSRAAQSVALAGGGCGCLDSSTDVGKSF